MRNQLRRPQGKVSVTKGDCAAETLKNQQSALGTQHLAIEIIRDSGSKL
jgi:hypothetical protein